MLFSAFPAAAGDAETCSRDSGDIAIAACTRAITSGLYDTRDLAALYSNRGLEYKNKGQHDRAIQDLDQGIRLNPQDAVAFLNRGIAYDSKAQLDRAIEDFDRAIQLNAQYAKAFYGRGMAKKANGDTPGGDADIAKARLLQPGIGQ